VAPQAFEHCPQLSASVWTLVHVLAQSFMPPAHAHAPFMQVVPPVQARPQVPQLDELCVRSTQTPEHEVVPPGQGFMQTPLLQTCPVLHAAPHAPQFLGSLVVETQAPPQGWLPIGQAHALDAQLMPEEQAWLHVPQFCGSLVVSTHAAPQAVKPWGQVVTQWPSAHTWLPVHAWPHAPQLAGSLRRSTH